MASWEHHPPGRMCAGTREVGPCSQACDLPHTCAHFIPLIDDLALTRSNLSPWPVLWAQPLAGRPAFPRDLQVVTGGAVHLFFVVHSALSPARPAISSLSRAQQGLGRWRGGQPERLPFACAFLFCGSSGINYHLMATPGPRPFACLSCEKDLEEPTYGFDRSNCRLIE